jgi:hypothetical protein
MEQTTGEAGQTYQFTVAQYTALSDEERSAIQKVADYLMGENLEAPDDESLSSTFNILRPCDGCVPEDEIGEDLLLDIRRKFACVYYSACELAEEEVRHKGFRKQHGFFFCLVVDASYLDATHVAVVDYDPEKRPFCYFLEYRKAKCLHFETLQAIAAEVLRARDEIVSTLLRVSVQPTISEKGEM